MASDGSEGTVFIEKLSGAILEGFPRWVLSDNVVSGNTLAEILETHVFQGLLIAIHSLDMDGDPTEYGLSGDLFLDCIITLVINNPDQASSPLPGDITGEIISPRPSLAVSDGLLRNALYKSTLDGFLWTLDFVGSSYPEIVEKPEGAVSRSYPIRGRKEVIRE